MIESEIKTRGRELGFDLVRICDARVPKERQAAYQAFIDAGQYGEMDWLAREPERRAQPKNLWAEVNSVIVCAMSYAPLSDPLAELAHRDAGVISVYARNRDYHDVIKGKLKNLAGWVAAKAASDVKVFVDTAPILEKPLAERAGVGWQGKHTNLVARQGGSWLFLGEIFTSSRLSADKSEQDHCGQCRRCLDICPTDAFPAPYRLDARRCISYLTIEHKSPIPREFRRAIGNRIYGCDDCLAICPWNKFALDAREAKLQGRPENTLPALMELLALDNDSFRQRFSGSPIKRIGRDRFLRNVLIAAGNSATVRLIPQIEQLLADPSPLVRGAAVWALRRLADGSRIKTLTADHLPRETNASVREEWTAVDG